MDVRRGATELRGTLSRQVALDTERGASAVPEVPLKDEILLSGQRQAPVQIHGRLEVRIP